MIFNIHQFYTKEKRIQAVLHFTWNTQESLSLWISVGISDHTQSQRVRRGGAGREEAQPLEGYCKHEAQAVKKCLPSMFPLRVHIQLTHLSWPVLITHSAARLKMIADTRFWWAAGTEREVCALHEEMGPSGSEPGSPSPAAWPGESRSEQSNHGNACAVSSFQMTCPNPSHHHGLPTAQPSCLPPWQATRSCKDWCSRGMPITDPDLSFFFFLLYSREHYYFALTINKFHMESGSLFLKEQCFVF